MTVHKTALATSIVLSLGMSNTKKNFDDIQDRIDEFNILNNEDVDYISLESLFNFYEVPFSIDRFESFYKKYLKIESDIERRRLSRIEKLNEMKKKHPILSHLNIF